MRLIVDWLKPVLAANPRLDPWVAPLGIFSRVQRNHLFDLVVADLARRSRTGLVAQTCQALGNEAIAPETYRETRLRRLAAALLRPHYSFTPYSQENHKHR